jgi:pimeloyl-ACP methyl ester carboxylesterase
VASERGAGLDGGVLALAPPADLAEAMAYVSLRPPLAHPLFATWLTLRAAATTRSRATGVRIDPVTPREAAELAIPAYYGVDAAEAARRSSPLAFVAELRVPVLVLHAVDDIVVPVSHADRLAAAAAGNDCVAVLRTEWGGHTAYDSLDPAWMAGVEAAWFGTLRSS